MNKELKERYPEWCNDNKKYYMCLSNDIDSLFSCIMLQQAKNYKISHFYSFDKLYQVADYKKNKNKLIGVDMDLIADGDYNPHCWGNHVVPFDNNNSANINVIEGISNYNYFHKYAGSTLLQIISYYNVDISNLNEEQLMVLLCVDSTFLQYSFNNAIAKHYLVDLLELPQLYTLCAKRTQEDFNNIITKYKLKEKIIVGADGKLQTQIDLQGLSNLFNLSFLLPKNTFELISEFNDIGINVSYLHNTLKKIADKNMSVFSSAMTNRNFIKISYN